MKKKGLVMVIAFVTVCYAVIMAVHFKFAGSNTGNITVLTSNIGKVNIYEDAADEYKVDASAVVNINTATLEELQTIPGVGIKTAEKILEYRKNNGGFSTIDELINIDGIGEKTLEKIKPMVKVE